MSCRLCGLDIPLIEGPVWLGDAESFLPRLSVKPREDCSREHNIATAFNDSVAERRLRDVRIDRAHKNRRALKDIPYVNAHATLMTTFPVARPDSEYASASRTCSSGNTLSTRGLMSPLSTSRVISLSCSPSGRMKRYS